MMYATLRNKKLHAEYADRVRTFALTKAGARKFLKFCEECGDPSICGSSTLDFPRDEGVYNWSWEAWIASGQTTVAA